MISQNLRPLFWDVNAEQLDPRAWPGYTIFRVLEYGDRDAVVWMRGMFTEDQIGRIIRTEQRLTPKSANFWALVYGIPASEVAALKAGEENRVAP